MKKTILAVAVPAALLFAAAASATTVYKDNTSNLDVFGRMKFSVDHGSAAGTTSSASTRLGFKGTSKINDGMTAYFRAGWEMTHNADQNTSTTNQVKARYNFVGIDFGKAGKVDFGQNDAPFYTSLTIITDVFDAYDMEATAQNYGTPWASNQALYTNTIGPVTVQASYQFHANNSSLASFTASTPSKQTMADSFAVVYDTGMGLGLHAATAHQSFGGGDNKNDYGLGVDYNKDNLMGALLYTHSKEETSAETSKRNAYETYVGYKMDQTTVKVGYAYGKQTGDVQKVYAKEFKVGLYYDFNSHLNGLFEYGNNHADAATDTNNFHASLTYNF